MIEATDQTAVSASPLGGAISGLDAWLQTMRCPHTPLMPNGGYGGPVAHWWRECYRYTGPALDWRYEGILTGYAVLYEKTHDPRWRLRLEVAAADLIDGQSSDGSYPASRFELNPGTLGTPHEAAATIGLLRALPALSRQEEALATAGRNLSNLTCRLRDAAGGFSDRPGVPGRVPNKLATLGHALLRYAEIRGEERLLSDARVALDDVCRYQIGTTGRETCRRSGMAGAIHQYDRGSGGDGRFLPYYAARCVPPLLAGARALGEARYLQAAEAIVGFLRARMNEDGSWPQIIYASGRRAETPRWLAGTADIMLAFLTLGEPIPAAALGRLLRGRLESGAFRTAEGFSRRAIGLGSRRRPVGTLPEYRDVTPVAGWNDKVLRLLAELLPAGAVIPETQAATAEEAVEVNGRLARLRDTPTSLTIERGGAVLYRWIKGEPWATGIPEIMDR
jgi:hypothetical protein